MWRIWFFFGILKISFAAPVATTQDEIVPSSELVVLKCLLSSPLNSCDDEKRSSESIPKRIQKLYLKLKRPLLNATSNEILDSASLDTLPASLLYLIPKVRLTSMSGFTASEIVRKFPFDDALTMKILSLFTDKTRIKNFLNGLADKEEMLFVSDDEILEEESITGIAPISPAVEKEVALAISNWFPDGSRWEYWLYKASMITGSPVLANLPNYFLNSLTLETTEKFLFHLRNWRWDSSKSYDSLWSQHSMSVKRVWASIVVKKAEPPQRWTPRILRKFGFFLIGATPDELSQLSTDLRISHDFDILLNLNWNTLQARAIFDIGYSGLDELHENNLNSAKNLITYLLPRQILMFSYNVTDFSFVKSNTGMSLPTEKQLFSSYLAFILSRKKETDMSSAFWKYHVGDVGKFYHLLPSSSLEVFLNDTLDIETLSKTDSFSLTFRQAHYLTKSGQVMDLSKPETVLKFKGLLKSIPSLKLIEKPSNLISHMVKEHLLMFANGESLPFTASVLQHIRRNLAQATYLEKMLYNKEFKQYFNLIGNRDIKHNFKDITSNLYDIVNRNPGLERNIRLLPSSTLSALLSLHRQDVIETDGGWTYENLVESPSRLYMFGLSCLDIEVLETADFMPVIGYYVHQRRAMNEPFPKNMQYCSQQGLTKYLRLKASLRDLSNEPLGLLNLLELHEVRAVGGYILAGLPINVIRALRIKREIISEIGKLTIPELLTATSLETVKEFTEMYITNSDKLNLETINRLGNLVWFLNEDKIERLDVEDFKLHLESLEENSGKSFCFNERERNSWKQLLLRMFGKPDSWSSGTLSYLGDLLFVLDGYELERINKTSWVEAADVLVKSTSFFTTLEWPGKTKPIHLYEACLEVLKIPERISYKMALQRLLRFYLESAQFLLDTVSPVQTILKLSEEPNLVENAHSMGSQLISTLVADHFPRLEITSSEKELNEYPSKSLRPENDEDYSSEENWDDNYYSDEDVDDDYDDDKVENNSESNKLSAQKVSKNNSAENETREESTVTSELTTTLPQNETTFEVQTEGFTSTSPDTSSNTPDMMSSYHSTTVITPTDGLSLSHEISVSEKNPSDSILKNKSSEKEDVNIFQSKSTKSLEELKEELQRNASRALIIEIPLNQSEFLNFSAATKHNMKISCDAIKMLGKSASLILDIQDLQKMDDTELEDCAEVLGSLKLETTIKRFIWSRLKKWKENGNLLEVGGLVSAIEEDEISKVPLRLTEPWALENMHVLSNHITEPDMMSFITDQFLLNNMDLQGLNYESAISLGRLVCTMTLSHQKKYLLSHPEVFINVAKTLGQSLDCSTTVFETCIHQLASIATSQEAFGETSEWNANDVSDLGVIVAGLKTSDWQNDESGKGLKAEALAGLTPTAVSCIPAEVFKVLTEEQLSRIPPLSAAVVSSEQTSSLSPSQYEILDRVRRQVPPDELVMSYASGVPSLKPSILFTASVYLTYQVTIRTFSYL